MAFTRLLDNLAVIAALDDEPNDIGGLTADQLKAKFDQAPLAVQVYLNNVLLPKLESIIDGDSAAESLGSATITGVSGHTIHAQLSDLKNQIVAMVAGAIPADSLTDALLSSAAGSVKTRVAALQAFPTATGTGTAVYVSCPYAALTDGIQTTFVASANNGGAATTLDLGGTSAKPVYKPGGTTAPTFAAGKAYTVWYSASGDCFFVKAGAEGSATAGHVLAGQTFSNDNDVGVMGTLALRTGNNTALSSSISGTTLRLVGPAGYYDGISDTTQITDPDFVSSNLCGDTNLFGLQGDPNVVRTGAGTAAAGDMLSGKIAFSKGVQVTGNIPSKGAATITPGTSDQTISAGQYLSGVQTIASLGGTATAAQVLNTVTFSSNSAGRAVSGTIPSKGAATYTPGTSAQTIAAGQYLSGTQTVAGSANLTAPNIRLGTNIFGVDGSLIPSTFAGGTLRLSPDKTAYLENTSGNYTMMYTSVTFTVTQNCPGTVQLYSVTSQGGMNAAQLAILRNGSSVWTQTGTGTISVGLDNLLIGETVTFRIGIADGNCFISNCYLRSSGVAT